MREMYLSFFFFGAFFGLGITAGKMDWEVSPTLEEIVYNRSLCWVVCRCCGKPEGTFWPAQYFKHLVEILQWKPLGLVSFGGHFFCNFKITKSICLIVVGLLPG